MLERKLLKDREALDSGKALGIEQILDEIQVNKNKYVHLHNALSMYGPRQLSKRLALILETLRKRGYIEKVKDDTVKYYLRRV